MNPNILRKAIVDARKARYENGAGGDATFVRGDVAGGTVRTPKLAETRDTERSDDERSDTD